MSTIDRPERLALLSPFVPGQRLDRATFHARYAAMPPDVHAELVGGIVYLSGAVGYREGSAKADVAGWLGHYRFKTRMVGGATNATTILGDDSEVQPDLQLRIPAESGGSTRIVDGFVQGPPELVVEVGASSRSHDLGAKKDDYRRAGVREHLFLGIVPDEAVWFALRDGRFVRIPPGDDGLIRSEVFPGLWLDPAALFGGDLDALITALDRGLATPDHAAFVARLDATG